MFEPDRETALTDVPGSFPHQLTKEHPWCCRVLSDDGLPPAEAPIGASPVFIGADPSCDVVLSDPAVSRRHVRIARTGNGIEICDLDSTNGVFCNGARIRSIVVRTRTRLRLGNTTVEISNPPEVSVAPSHRTRFGNLVGGSLVMREIFALLELASPTDATVVIEGASGTGKEVAARGIHDHSTRASKPFVVVDCCAAAETLIESQLFGHRVGSFTGAVKDRDGAFLRADGGTLFLDELGDLPLMAQGKLLRVLEAGSIQPIGDDRPIFVNVRVIAATNRNLRDMVDRGLFRFDLYHRLAVIHLKMPSLAEHLEDLPMLIRNFYEGRGVDPGPIRGRRMQVLEQYDCPGNVRELRNCLERAWVLAGPGGNAFENLVFHPGASANLVHSPLVDTSIPFKDAKEAWNGIFEHKYVEAVFAMHNGSISKAAAYAGINRNHFARLLARYGLTKAQLKRSD